MRKLQVISSVEDINEFVSNTWRPKFFTKDGRLALNERKELIANAQLTRDQWEQIDLEVVTRARQTYSAWAELESRGLTSVTSLAEWLSTWRVQSEMTEASVSLDFETRGNEDRTQAKRYSVPLPLIYKEFSFGRRELLTAQQTGQSLEMDDTIEAAEAVAEKAESILLDGDTSQVLEGNSISGLTTLSGRYSTTGEGDFGTIDNIYKTFLDTVTTMGNRRFNGPFGVEMHPTQYNQMLEYYSDGTGQTAMDRVLKLPQIAYINRNDLLTTGEMVLYQLDKKVLDIRTALPLQTRRWDSPSGNRVHLVVIMAAAPRLKTQFSGYAGIAHISSI